MALDVDEQAFFGRPNQPPIPYLGGGYTLAMCLGYGLRIASSRAHAPTLHNLGTLVLGISTLALYIAVTWYRDDDAMAAGVLLGLTSLIGSLVATVVAATVVTQSLTAGLGLLVFSPFVLLMQSIILIPASAALVWFARKVSAGLQRVIGKPPDSGASTR